MTDALQGQEASWLRLKEKKLSQHLPPYERATGTQKILLAFFIFSLALSMVGFAIGIQDPPTISPSSEPVVFWQVLPTIDTPPGISYSIKSKAYTLLFTLTISICTECLGCIHSTSLRWALAKEGRLEFNSNLRLFSSAHTSVGNG